MPSTIHIAAQGYDVRNSQKLTPERTEEIGDICHGLILTYSQLDAFNLRGVQFWDDDKKETRFTPGALERHGIDVIEDEEVIVPFCAWREYPIGGHETDIMRLSRGFDTTEQRAIIIHPYGSDRYKRRIITHMFGHFLLGTSEEQIPELELTTFTETILGPLGMFRRMVQGLEYKAHLELHHKTELGAFRENREENRRHYDQGIARRVLNGNNHNP